MSEVSERTKEAGRWSERTKSVGIRSGRKKRPGMWREVGCKDNDGGNTMWSETAKSEERRAKSEEQRAKSEEGRGLDSAKSKGIKRMRMWGKTDQGRLWSAIPLPCCTLNGFRRLNIRQQRQRAS